MKRWKEDIDTTVIEEFLLDNERLKPIYVKFLKE